MLLEQLRLFIDTNQYNFPELALIIVGYLAVMWLGIVFWVWRDITTRTSNLLVIIGAVLLVAFGNILGLILYLLLRPAHARGEVDQHQLLHHSLLDPQLTMCAHCHALVREEFVHCPYCGQNARLTCPKCEHRIHPEWQFCAQCGQDLRPAGLVAKLKASLSQLVTRVKLKARLKIMWNRYVGWVENVAKHLQSLRKRLTSWIAGLKPQSKS